MKRDDSNGGSNVRRLEKHMSLWNRLFNLLAVRRGALRLRRWLKLALLLVPIFALLWIGVSYLLEKAYGLSVEQIRFKSADDIINKQQALDILELGDSVNMATLNTESLRRKLEANDAIRSAAIRAELPDTLYIEVDERIPIVYVTWEDGARSGDNTKLFMDPEGVLFAVNDELHRNFLGVPTWYLRPGDAEELKPGVKIDPHKVRPIARLIAASNLYTPEEIPPITEIFRPKDWQIRLILDNGAEITMEVRNIREQMDRLAMILDHARATHRRVRTVDVIPALNPTVIFEDESSDKQSNQ